MRIANELIEWLQTVSQKEFESFINTNAFSEKHELHDSLAMYDTPEEILSDILTNDEMSASKKAFVQNELNFHAESVLAYVRENASCEFPMEISVPFSRYLSVVESTADQALFPNMRLLAIAVLEREVVGDWRLAISRGYSSYQDGKDDVAYWQSLSDDNKLLPTCILALALGRRLPNVEPQVLSQRISSVQSILLRSRFRLALRYLVEAVPGGESYQSVLDQIERNVDT